MQQPFEIIFDFPLADPDLIISLRATAELHHSAPYWIIDDFHLKDSNRQHDASILPPLEIKKIKRDSSELWVHGNLC